MMVSEWEKEFKWSMKCHILFWEIHSFIHFHCFLFFCGSIYDLNAIKIINKLPINFTWLLNGEIETFFVRFKDFFPHQPSESNISFPARSDYDLKSNKKTTTTEFAMQIKKTINDNINKLMLFSTIIFRI